jgi:predicted phosphoribosyltransferase
VGALAEPDVVILDEDSLLEFSAPREELDKVIAEEMGRLREYRLRFHRAEMPLLDGQTVLLVDDGLATGATAEAAVQSVKRQNAERVIITAPVASTNAIERLRRVADDVVVLLVDAGFRAVGQYYDEFFPTTDDEVIALLRGTESV